MSKHLELDTKIIIVKNNPKSMGYYDHYGCTGRITEIGKGYYRVLLDKDAGRAAAYCWGIYQEDCMPVACTNRQALWALKR